MEGAPCFPTFLLGIGSCQVIVLGAVFCDICDQRGKPRDMQKCLALLAL